VKRTLFEVYDAVSQPSINLVLLWDSFLFVDIDKILAITSMELRVEDVKPFP